MLYMLVLMICGIHNENLCLAKKIISIVKVSLGNQGQLTATNFII